MKKTIIFIFALFISLTTFAQLEVKDGSFKEVPGVVNINPDPVYQTDDNDLPFAVIKVKTDNINDKQRRKLHFEGNAGTFIMLEYKVGEVWVYLTAKYADYLKISHPDLSSVEFHFPYDLLPKRGYEMTLINKSEPVVNGWASLTIKTQPENGGSITLNGRSLNETTPYTNSMIPSGKYEITVSKDRYKTVTQTIEVVDGDSKIVEIVMSLDVANITLIADQYTEVYVDGEFKTEGTWNGELYSGSHKIVYKKPFHKDASQIIHVEAGASKKIELKPIPINGIISVETEPSGATVYIDNVNIGTTPLKCSYIIGKHKVEVNKRGFEPLSWYVNMQENDTLYYDKTLTVLTYITIQTGAYDQIYIDGQYEGYAPVKKKLPVGKHTIIVQRVNCKPIEQEIDVEADGDKVFNIIVDNNIKFTNNESSYRYNNSSDIEGAYYHPENNNDKFIYSKKLDLVPHFDIGCFAGFGYRRLFPEYMDNNSLYFAKGLYAIIKLNNIGLKAEISNLKISGREENNYIYSSTVSRSEYTCNFSMVNIPIMIGYEIDYQYGFLLSVYLGPQINICNSATYSYVEYGYALDAVSSTKQSISNYEKTSYNLAGEFNIGWCFKNISISFISMKFDLTMPTLIKNNGSENFSNNMKYYSWSMSMQFDYNFK